MSLAARIQGVSALAAGDAVVQATELERALGAPAWHVWHVLLSCRDATGETHITHRGILRARGFVRAVKHGTQVDRAMRRLETAKLVQPIGKVFRNVPSRAGEIERQVYVRNVWGARLLRTSPTAPAEYAVPTATKGWIMTAIVRGGARPGSGPKPKRSRHTFESKTYSNVCPGLPPVSIQTCAPSKRSKSKNVNTLTRGGILLPTEEEVHAAASAAGSLFEFETDLGSVLAGSSTHRGVGLADPIPGVPLYPGHSVVSPATTPDAPELEVGAGYPAFATAMVRAYRGAIEKRFGRQKRPILARGDITRSKHFAHLTAFADELIRHEIPPATWCIHRVDLWRELAKGKNLPKTPSLTWVFNMKAISDELRWKFRAEYGAGRIGGRAVFSKAHLKLLAIYGAMKRDLATMKKADAVAKHFPNGLYDELVDQARRDAAETRYRLECDIQRGRHVWG